MKYVDIAIDRHQVRQHFSRHASEYDRYALVQRKVATRLSESVQSFDGEWNRALEVGCGTGYLSLELTSKCPRLPLVLSDIAHGMTVATASLLPGRPVCDADALSLPFSDGAFDLLVSSSVYQWVDNLPAAFAEAARVLRPRGIMAIALFGGKTLYELKQSYQLALAGKEPHDQTFYSNEEVVEALGKWFAPIEIRSEFEIEWHANVAELLRNLKRIGAQNASRKRPSGLASRQVMQQMMTAYQRNFGDSQGIPATYEVIYLLARRSPQGEIGY